MNHAFVFQIHSYAEQFGEIINLLSAPNHYFFINVDKKVNDTPFKAVVKGIDNVFFTEGKDRITVNHSGFSQIRCTLNLLNMILQSNIDIDYFHSLSGQDYPCVSNGFFDSFFEKNQPRSYMFFDSSEEIELWRKKKYPNRYRRFYATDMKLFPIRKIDKALKLLIDIYTKSFYTRPLIGNVVGGGSWFSWHKSVVTYVLEFLTANKWYLNRFRWTSCCDEIIFHTLVWDKTEMLNIERYNSLRFIEWHPKRAYSSLPLILKETEFHEIIASQALFCRKISPIESSRLISLLKEHIKSMI